jgi:hypothetical protein
MLSVRHPRCIGEEMGTASVLVNRVSAGLAPPIYGPLYAEARRLRIGMPELIRHIFLEWIERHPNGAGDRKEPHP